MFADKINIADAAGVAGGLPVLGGIFMWIRKTGEKKAREESRLRALECRQVETEKAIVSLANSQNELHKALDHQTETLSSRLDKVVEVLLLGRGGHRDDRR
jgi:uncharacterized coiled-coil protein SlyX